MTQPKKRRRTKDKGRMDEVVKPIVPASMSAHPYSSPALEILEASKAPEEEKLYTIGKWRGIEQYKCTLCPWDTLEGEAEMLEHLASAHKPPPSPILIADKSGRQIN